MRFASVTYDGRPTAVAVDDDLAIPLAGIDELGLLTPSSVLGEPPLDRDRAVAIDLVRLRPVVPRPSKIICVGLNYAEHIDEGVFDRPDYPVLFTKFAASLVGADEPIVKPSESAAVDYEGELAVVIGEHCRRVPREQALSTIAGYAIANDVTMRDYQYKTHQWLQGKSWERSTPLGPWLVTPDEVGEIGDLSIRTWVNGELVQQASTAQMIFDVPELIATISEFTSLEPGDVILTGTPSGVGYRREPQLLLGDGDTVTVEIERVGRLESRVVAED